MTSTMSNRHFADVVGRNIDNYYNVGRLGGMMGITEKYTNSLIFH